MVNDYLNNSVIWLYLDLKDFSQIHFFNKYSEGKIREFALCFGNDGFILKDFEINSKIIIKSSDIDKFDIINIYNFKHLIMQFEVLVWDESTIVDSFEN